MTFTEECPAAFMASFFILHRGKAVAQIAIVEATNDHLLDI
jgi:hypothetical protein